MADLINATGGFLNWCPNQHSHCCRGKFSTRHKTGGQESDCNLLPASKVGVEAQGVLVVVVVVVNVRASQKNVALSRSRAKLVESGVTGMPFHPLFT